MNTQTQSRPAPAGPDERGEVQHVVCCRDSDTALCRLDVSAHGWATGCEPVCPVCEGIDAARRCRRVFGLRLGCPIRGL